MVYEKQQELYQNGNAEKSFYLVMNFDDEYSKQLQNILTKRDESCKVVVIQSYFDESNTPMELNEQYTDYEGLELNNSSRYTDEKRKGGASSYQRYKPLKNKVESLCRQELAKKKYCSAR